MSARSRNPDTESFGIESSSVLASSRLQTGVLPFFTTYFGPRTACAGFDGVICRTTMAANGTWYAYETADAVEREAFDVNGIPMSNFVYPSWFEAFHKPKSTKFDYMGKCTRPFQILKG